MNALDISSITFSYDGAPVCALQNFSLTVADGRMQALLGPNGAGKSTLMRIITGQLRGYSGDVFIYGDKMPDRSALLSIGYAPQPISLYHVAYRPREPAFLRRDGRTVGRTNCIAFGNRAGTDRPYRSCRRTGGDRIPGACKDA